MINISIEPTNFCNAECYYYINGIDQLSRSQRREYLSLETHSKLIRELDIFIKDFHCAPTFDKSIYLRYCGVGEPTLHPDFIKMFKEGLMCSHVKMLAILSNGTGWIKRMTDELIETIASRINIPIELIFSLDTTYPQTQFRIKKLSNIDVVIKQLTYLVDKKIKKKINNIYIIFQIIILEDNINEVKQFCNFWTKLITNKGCCIKIVYMPTYANLFSKNNFFIWLKCRQSDNISQKNIQTCINML